jgi:hypothetical protein
MSVRFKTLNSYINFSNTTSTFKNLINKYRKKSKEGQAKNDKNFIQKKIHAKLQEIERNEQDKDYIISEVRRNAQINREILYSFGSKALNHIDEIKKINVSKKLDKSFFYEPDKESDLYDINQYMSKNKTIKAKNAHDRILNLPQIARNKNRRLNYSENKSIHDSISINKRTENSFSKKNNDSIDSKINKSNKNNDIYQSIRNLSPIGKKEISNNLNISNYKTPLITDRETNDIKSTSRINTFRKKQPRISLDYINYIQSIKDKFIDTEKNQKIYFENNNYGYDAYKLKYNYIKKKYFN